MKPIIHSAHAKERLTERGVTRAHIERAIRAPDLTQLARRGRVRVSKQFGSRTLHVFYKELPSTLLVVTAYWKGKAK